MWAAPYSQELDCFLRRGNQQDHIGYQILEAATDVQGKKSGKAEAAAGAATESGSSKVSFDVALDTDDLGLLISKEESYIQQAEREDALKKHQQQQQIKSQRKISFQECKSLLKKKLADNKHTKWIQKQWEKHRGDPARIKEKLVARNFLGNHHGDCRSRPGSAQGNNISSRFRSGKCVPLAYSFISFKAGISTVDCKTQLLPAECIHAWRRWKSSKTALQLPFKSSLADRSNSQDDVGQGLSNEEDHRDEEAALRQAILDEELEKSMLREIGLLARSTAEASSKSSDAAAAAAAAIGDDDDQQRLSTEVVDAACRAESSDQLSTSCSEQQQQERGSVDESFGAPGELMMISLKPDASSSPSSRKSRSCAAAELTAELTKYLLFRELVKGMSTTSSTTEDACSSSENPGASPQIFAAEGGDLHQEQQKLEPDQEELAEQRQQEQEEAQPGRAEVDAKPLELAVDEAQKTMQEEVVDPTKPLSPYRVLFEERNKDLLQGLLASLSEEAQLIKQAWTCGFKPETSSNTRQEEGAKVEVDREDDDLATDKNCSSSSVSEAGKIQREKERVSLFLSLKDGKIQLKDHKQQQQQQKDRLQHDCLSSVVKKHGMSTGFYMKITQEELLKKLPTRGPRLRQVPGRRSRTSMQ